MRFPILILLFLPVAAWARLGENRQQLVERLGPVRSESRHYIGAQGRMSALGPALFFQKDQWHIQADLVNGQCVRLTYSKRGDWTEEQKKTLLVNNAQSQAWEVARDSSKMIRKWRRQDGSTAEWKFTGSLQIVSRAYLDAKRRREAELKQAAEKKPDDL